MIEQNQQDSDRVVRSDARAVRREAETKQGSGVGVSLAHLASSTCSEPLLDVDQAAAYIGMSAKWVYRNYAILPHRRIGEGPRPRIKFRRCDLDRWIEAGVSR
jgi:predicted DNA-binding transcriptional regulator AlpA